MRIRPLKVCRLVVLRHHCLQSNPAPDSILYSNFTALQELIDASMIETECTPTVISPVTSTAVTTTPVTSTVVGNTSVTSTTVYSTSEKATVVANTSVTSTVVSSTPVKATVVSSTPVKATVVSNTLENVPVSSALTTTMIPSVGPNNSQSHTPTIMTPNSTPTIIAPISAVVITTVLVIIAAIGICILMRRKRTLDRKMLLGRENDGSELLDSTNNSFARLSVSLAEENKNLPLTDNKFPVSRPMSVVRQVDLKLTL